MSCQPIFRTGRVTPCAEPAGRPSDDHGLSLTARNQAPIPPGRPIDWPPEPVRADRNRRGSLERAAASLRMPVPFLWAYTGGALYNRFVANGAKLGAGVGAAQNFGSNMSIDMDQFRVQRKQLQDQIADPSAQTAATETKVDQHQETNARNFQNFGQARVTDAAAVLEGGNAAAAIGVDSYAILTAPGAARALAGGIKAAAGGIKAAAGKLFRGSGASEAAAGEAAAADTAVAETPATETAAAEGAGLAPEVKPLDWSIVSKAGETPRRMSGYMAATTSRSLCTAFFTESQ